MMICSVCKSTEFTSEDGVLICNECNSQVEGAREEAVDREVRSRKTLVSSPAADRSSDEETVLHSTWTTTEAYNIIICEQVSALINLGASNKLKDVVLYIWSRYLQKCEVAFRQKDQFEKQLPRLSLFAKKRDFKVLYGDKYFGRKKKKIKRKLTKKKQTNGSRKKFGKTLDGVSDTNESKNEENVEKENLDSDILDDTSEAESSAVNDNEMCDEPDEIDEKPDEIYDEPDEIDDDVYSSHAQKRKNTHRIEKKMSSSIKELCVENMTLSKTLCFCYLGLIYTGDQLLLSDLIRFVHEGRVPYLRAADCLPPYMTLQGVDHSSFNMSTTPDLWKISLMCAKLIDFITLPKFKHRSLIPIAFRFVKDLNLPDNIIPIVKILIAKSKNQEDWYETKKVSSKYFPLPLYEVQAMAYIIIVLKVIFVLDGKFESEHSEIMTKISAVLEDRKLFVWNKWKRQASLIEYLFMKSGSTYSNFSLFDSLSADEIISKYPFIHSRETGEFPNKRICLYSTARHAISNIFKKINPIDDKNDKPAPTSFPLKQQIAYLMTHWRYLPMYKETEQIDFAFLSENFSSHQLYFKPTSRDDTSSVDLIAFLLASLYESVEILTLSHAASNYQNILRSTSKYWFKNFSQKQLSGSESAWLDTLPSSFKWLLRFLCKYSQISCEKMYCEVVRLEKELFLQVKKVKV